LYEFYINIGIGPININPANFVLEEFDNE